MYTQNPPPQYPHNNGQPNVDYSHAPSNNYQYPQEQHVPQQTWRNDSQQLANGQNRNPHAQDLLTDNPFGEKKPVVSESLMDDFATSSHASQRMVKPVQQNNFPPSYSNAQPPSVNPPQSQQVNNMQPQPPKTEPDTQSLALINQMQSYFLKIMQYMDNVDKRITSLEKMTKELQEKAQTAPASTDGSSIYAHKPEIDSVKKAQETLANDLELARKLQLEFNDEVSKSTKPKSTPTPTPSSVSSSTKKTSGTTGQCPICNKVFPNIETHTEECLAEAERQEKSKPKPGSLYELGKQPPMNAMPTNRTVMAPPMPPSGQPPYYPYPSPYFVDPQTGQMAYYPYPPTMQPPSYQGNPK